MKYSTLLLISFSVFLACETPAVRETLSEENSSEKRQAVVFIAGFDEDDNRYYANAKEYFQQKQMAVVEGLYSLEEILNWLKEHHKAMDYGDIHIVSHSNAWRGMALKLTAEGNRITSQSLDKANKLGALPELTEEVNPDTRIIFHSCGLGKSSELLLALQKVFSGAHVPKIFAAKHFNVFGGKYAGHYLARPYYVFYPTAHSPGPRALSESMKKAYPNEEIDWFTALKTREETTLGGVYSYRFNIPVHWEVTFDNVTVIPKLKDREAIMDWVAGNDAMARTLFELGIPLEKFRWKSRISGNTLILEGKTTALCVLQPLMDPEEGTAYQIPAPANEELYTGF